MSSYCPNLNMCSFAINNILDICGILNYLMKKQMKSLPQDL